MSKATNIRAELLDEDENKHLLAKKIPGAFYYYGGEPGGIIHSCPCGCGQLGTVNLDPLARKANRPLWINVGTRERPNLRPSVGIKAFRAEQSIEDDGYHWHGWLRDGVWVSA